MIIDRTIMITVRFKCDGCAEPGASNRLVAPELARGSNFNIAAAELKMAETVDHGESDWVAYG